MTFSIKRRQNIYILSSYFKKGNNLLLLQALILSWCEKINTNILKQRGVQKLQPAENEALQMLQKVPQRNN